jgi:hypothetical protein
MAQIPTIPDLLTDDGSDIFYVAYGMAVMATVLTHPTERDMVMRPGARYLVVNDRKVDLACCILTAIDTMRSCSTDKNIRDCLSRLPVMGRDDPFQPKRPPLPPPTKNHVKTISAAMREMFAVIEHLSNAPQGEDPEEPPPSSILSAGLITPPTSLTLGDQMALEASAQLSEARLLLRDHLSPHPQTPRAETPRTQQPLPPPPGPWRQEEGETEQTLATGQARRPVVRLPSQPGGGVGKAKVPPKPLPKKPPPNPSYMKAFSDFFDSLEGGPVPVE